MYPYGLRWLTACFMLIAQLSMASTITSNGTGGGNWNLPGSWSGGVPGAGDDVVILAGDQINVTTSQSCNNLQIAGTLTFNTASKTITVNGDLTFSGTGTINGSASTSKSINVSGNLYSLSGADGIVGGINFTISGSSTLNGRITFSSSTGSKTLTGDVLIGDGGAIEFSTGSINLILINNLSMQGTSSLGGGSSSTGTVIGVNAFTVASGANATIGRVTMAIIGLTQFNGNVLFNNSAGSKSFVGGLTLNNSTVDFSGAAALSCNDVLTFNGTCAIGASSTATGSLSTTSSASIPAGTSVNLGRFALTVGTTTTIDGTLTISNATGAKSFGGDVSVGTTGSLLFTAAATLTFGGNLTTSPGSNLGGGGSLGTINVTNDYTAITGGTSLWNNIKLTMGGNLTEGVATTIQCTAGTNTIAAGGNFTIPGTSTFDFSTGTNNLSIGGNWNITSSAANPFVEGTSRVTLNGSTGTQLITTTESGGEHFYNLTINNTSPANPSLSTAVSINVAHSITFTSGILDLTGKNLAISGDATTSTDTYTAGQIITSVAGSQFTVTDASINKTVNFNGTGFGDATHGIQTTLTAANSYFNGSYFYGQADFTKTGTSGNDCSGGNTFYGPVTFTTVSGADRWRMGLTNPDVFYTATFTHNGNNNFIVARSSTGNQFYGTTTITSSTAGGFYVARNNGGTGGTSVFHGPVVVNVTLTGNVTFGESSVTNPHDVTFESTIQVNSTVSSTGDVTFGSTGSGSETLTTTGQFIGGSILGASTITLYRLTQNGTTLPQTITASGTSIITTGSAAGNGATFNANVAFTAPQVRLLSSTFNGTTNTFTQTGTVTNATMGGNTFAAGTTSTFTNQGTGGWRIGASAADNFNGNVNFIRQSGAGAIEPAYTNASNFAGNISTTGSSTSVTFGNNGGRVNITGAGARAWNGDSSFPPIITRLTMNSSGALTLNVPASVTTDINFTSGVINTTATNILTLNAGSTLSGTPSNTSYIEGPVQKVGNTAFTFPTGNSGIYRPIAISAPTTASTFSAQFMHTSQAFGNNFDPSFYTVSGCEYWVLNRVSGTGNASVTLSWNSPDCTGTYIGDLPTLRVARWTGALWTSEGNGGTTGNTATGTVVSAAAVTTFGPFALASTSSLNPLPVELVDFRIVSIGNTVQLQWATLSEIDNEGFEIERSQNGASFVTLGHVAGSGTTHTRHPYSFIDNLPLTGTAYYRLKQISFDGSYTYSNVLPLVMVETDNWTIFPNPVQRGGSVFMNKPTDVVILNSLGQTVLHATQAQQLDLSALPSGLYLMYSSEGQMRKLIVK